MIPLLFRKSKDKESVSYSALKWSFEIIPSPIIFDEIINKFHFIQADLDNDDEQFLFKKQFSQISMTSHTFECLIPYIQIELMKSLLEIVIQQNNLVQTVPMSQEDGFFTYSEVGFQNLLRLHKVEMKQIILDTFKEYGKPTSVLLEEVHFPFLEKCLNDHTPAAQYILNTFYTECIEELIQENQLLKEHGLLSAQ